MGLHNADGRAVSPRIDARVRKVYHAPRRPRGAASDSRSPMRGMGWPLECVPVTVPLIVVAEKTSPENGVRRDVLAGRGGSG